MKTVYINLITIVINILLLTEVIKLYTEYFKDKSITARGMK